MKDVVNCLCCFCKKAIANVVASKMRLNLVVVFVVADVFAVIIATFWYATFEQTIVALSAVCVAQWSGLMQLCFFE